MKIVYTRHAEQKFRDLAAHGVSVNKRLVNRILNNPLHLDEAGNQPNVIASGKLDNEHVLRVVYRKERGRIAVITFYPAKKGRYF